MPLAMKDGRPTATVVVVILRPVDWEGTALAALPCLPANLLPVTLWGNLDAALLDIERGVRHAIEARVKGLPFRAPEPAPQTIAPPQDRRLDAAVPSRVIVGELTEILAMIATADSGGLRALVNASPTAFPVTPGDVRTTRFDLEFPVDAQGHLRAATVAVLVQSKDFDPPSVAKKILVPPRADSPVCTLLMRPRHAGVLSLDVELTLADVTIWSERLETQGTDQNHEISRDFVVASIPLSTRGVQQAADLGHALPAAGGLGEREEEEKARLWAAYDRTMGPSLGTGIWRGLLLAVLLALVVGAWLLVARR
jgi:hypothetical protein